LGQGESPLLLAGHAAPAEPPREHSRETSRDSPRQFEARAPSRQGSSPGRMETFRLDVGSVHGIKPGNIVGAIANEAGIEGEFIGRVDIRDDHSFVDLPEGMPKPVFKQLQKVRVGGRELKLSKVEGKPPRPAAARRPAAGKKLTTRREARY